MHMAQIQNKIIISISQLSVQPIRDKILLGSLPKTVMYRKELGLLLNNVMFISFQDFSISAITMLAPSDEGLLSNGYLSPGSGQESFAQCFPLLGKSLEYSEPQFSPLQEIVVLSRCTSSGFCERLMEQWMLNVLSNKEQYKYDLGRE